MSRRVSACRSVAPVGPRTDRISLDVSRAPEFCAFTFTTTFARLRSLSETFALHCPHEMSFKGKQPERTEAQRAVDDFIARAPDAPVSFDTPARGAEVRRHCLCISADDAASKPTSAAVRPLL